MTKICNVKLILDYISYNKIMPPATFYVMSFLKLSKGPQILSKTVTLRISKSTVKAILSPNDKGRTLLAIQVNNAEDKEPCHLHN